MVHHEVNAQVATTPQPSATKTTQVNAQTETTPVPSLGRMHIARTVFTRHPVKFPAIILIAAVSPLLGLVLVGMVGVAVGWLINAIGLWLGYSAVRAEVVKTIHADHGSLS